LGQKGKRKTKQDKLKEKKGNDEQKIESVTK